jgi:rhomboid protease GluP
VLERAIGSLRFAVIYLLSALGGSLLSAFWYGYHETSGLFSAAAIHPVVSVGASGAIMGLAGAAGALALYQSADSSHDAPVRIRGSAIAQVIAINLVSGFVTSGVDQAAHVGGLIVGFLAGLALYPISSSASLLRRVGLPLVIGIVGTVAMVFTAMHGQSETLLDWQDALTTQRAQEASERVAAQAKEVAKQEAIKESKEIADMVREDEKARPAPVTLDEAAGTVIKLGKQPDHMVIGPSGKYVYITDNADNAVSVVDIDKREVVRTIQGGPFKTGLGGCPHNYCRGRGATGIVVSPDEHYAYVASIREDSLARIDLTKGTVVDAVKLGRFPREVVASSANDRLYVLNGVDDTVSVVSLTEWPKVLATLELSSEEAGSSLAFGRPLVMWLSSDNQHLYTNSAGKNGILEFDTKTYQLVQEHPMDSGFVHAMNARTGTGVWLYADALSWADPSTLATRKTYPICGSSDRMLATSPDGKFIAATDPSGSMLRVIKVATRLTIGAYPVKSGASQVIFSQDGKSLYALSSDSAIFGSGSLSIIDLSKSIDVKSDPEQGEFLCPVSPDGETASTSDD